MKALIRGLFGSAVAVFVLCTAGVATAQSYPGKPIVVKVAYPPGFGGSMLRFGRRPR